MKSKEEEKDCGLKCGGIMKDEDVECTRLKSSTPQQQQTSKNTQQQNSINSPQQQTLKQIQQHSNNPQQQNSNNSHHKHSNNPQQQPLLKIDSKNELEKFDVNGLLLQQQQLSQLSKQQFQQQQTTAYNTTNQSPLQTKTCNNTTNSNNTTKSNNAEKINTTNINNKNTNNTPNNNNTNNTTNNNNTNNTTNNNTTISKQHRFMKLLSRTFLSAFIITPMTVIFWWSTWTATEALIQPHHPLKRALTLYPLSHALFLLVCVWPQKLWHRGYRNLTSYGDIGDANKNKINLKNFFVKVLVVVWKFVFNLFTCVLIVWQWMGTWTFQDEVLGVVTLDMGENIGREVGEKMGEEMDGGGMNREMGRFNVSVLGPKRDVDMSWFVKADETHLWTHLGIALLLSLLMRMCCNLTNEVTQGAADEGLFYEFESKFHLDSAWSINYVYDCIFSHVILGTLIVYFWRFMWMCFDVYIYPHSEVLSAVVGVGVVYGVVLLQSISRGIQIIRRRRVVMFGGVGECGGKDANGEKECSSVISCGCGGGGIKKCGCSGGSNKSCGSGVKISGCRGGGINSCSCGERLNQCYGCGNDDTESFGSGDKSYGGKSCGGDGLDKTCEIIKNVNSLTSPLKCPQNHFYKRAFKTSNSQILYLQDDTKGGCGGSRRTQEDNQHIHLNNQTILGRWAWHVIKSIFNSTITILLWRCLWSLFPLATNQILNPDWIIPSHVLISFFSFCILFVTGFSQFVARSAFSLDGDNDEVEATDILFNQSAIT